MKVQEATKDLVVLAADKDMEFTIKGLLSKPERLGIRSVTNEILVHINHDPGCLLDGHNVLRVCHGRYRHAMIMLDRDGCGRESATRTDLESEIEQRLRESGWGDRAAAVVIDPELEIWIWSQSPEVDRALGWSGANPDLRSALKTEGLLTESFAKPMDPKAAMKYALRKARVNPSASIYFEIAQNVSFKRCEDPSFIKFRTILQTWFPSTPGRQLSEA